MNVVVHPTAMMTRLASAGRPPNDAIAGIEVFSDVALAEPAWRSLEREAIATPYQRFDFLAPWQRHVGRHAGVRPFVVTGFDRHGRPAFLWPLGMEKKGPLRIVRFLGGKHANFNFALWRGDAAASLGAADLRNLLARVGSDHGIDLYALLRQPASWDGAANPFALLPHQRSADDCARLVLQGTGAQVIEQALSAAMRGRLRTKERKLKKLAGYRYFRADAGQIDRLLDAFFPLKAAHMGAQGIANAFAQPGVEAFVREVCQLGSSLIEIHALEGDGEILAIFVAITDGRRFSLMFNTYTRSDHARQSPGLVLLVHVITQCADRGLQIFDLGVGEAGYKSFFCKEPEPLFDSFLPLTTAGRLAAMAARSGHRAKGWIKHSPILWDNLQELRRRLRGRG
jgi:CelD/BcsL family acetyltransferase involved in cellulose biosynthesis